MSDSPKMHQPHLSDTIFNPALKIILLLITASNNANRQEHSLTHTCPARGLHASQSGNNVATARRCRRRQEHVESDAALVLSALRCRETRPRRWRGAAWRKLCLRRRSWILTFCRCSVALVQRLTQPSTLAGVASCVATLDEITFYKRAESPGELSRPRSSRISPPLTIHLQQSPTKTLPPPRPFPNLDKTRNSNGRPAQRTEPP